MVEVTRALLTLLESGEGRGALATVTATAGSAPGRVGARLLLRPDGTAVGTVGGGAVEAAVLDALRAVSDGEDPRTLDLDLGELGMCCGGRMTVFVEGVETAPRLVLVGAGHVAMPTAAMARTAGFAITVVDARAELNTEARFPGCARIVGEAGDAIEDLPASPGTFYLVLTHDHRLDEAALEVCLRRPHRYVGLIGSRRKVLRILRRMRGRAALPELGRLHAPVGLDVGAVTPEEIAVSIVAELVAVRRGRTGRHLRVVDHPLFSRILDGDAAVAEVDGAAAKTRETAEDDPGEAAG